MCVWWEGGLGVGEGWQLSGFARSMMSLAGTCSSGEKCSCE